MEDFTKLMSEGYLETFQIKKKPLKTLYILGSYSSLKSADLYCTECKFVLLGMFANSMVYWNFMIVRRAAYILLFREIFNYYYYTNYYLIM